MAKALEPTIKSLPKNARGAVSAASARYLLHRLFVQRHGWLIKGAAPDGTSWTPTSPVLGVGSFLPPRVRELFEMHLGSNGEYTPREVLVLAASIEALVRVEALGRLTSTYHLLGKDPRANVNGKDSARVIDVYLQSVIMAQNVSELSLDEFERSAKDFTEHFPYWPQVRQSVDEAHRHVAPSFKALAFSDMARIMEGVDDRLAHHLDESNCHEMRDHLVQVQDGNITGRARLRDFYKSAVDGRAWQFSDSVDYLRKSGMLDESDASNPRLIIANYLYMHGDCLQTSDFYSLCCISPCEGLFNHLERTIQAPRATPEEIVRIVSALPSASVPATRTLAPALVKKLEDVAENHGGLVPLHGRLFAQWMHFAYPLECPYPHVSGTTKLMSTIEFFDETGVEPGLNESQMKSYMESLPAAPPAVVGGIQGSEPSSDALSTMWRDEEELVEAADWHAGIQFKALAPRSQVHHSSLGLRACALPPILVACGIIWSRVRRGPLSTGGAPGAETSANGLKHNLIFI